MSPICGGSRVTRKPARRRNSPQVLRDRTVDRLQAVDRSQRRACSNVAFFEGSADTTHISSVSGGVKISQKGQTLSGMKFAVFTDSNRWFVQGDNRLSLTSQNTYGLGSDTGPADSANVKYQTFSACTNRFTAISAEGLYVGGGLNFSAHTNIRPGTSSTDVFDDSAYLAYTSRNGFGTAGQTSAGPGVGLIFDTRDNAINAHAAGWQAPRIERFSTASWAAIELAGAYLDVRTYRNLEANGRQRSAFWFLSDMVVGGTAPYLDLPATAGDTYGRSARGYSEGRYRGEHLAYGEVEYSNTFDRQRTAGVRRLPQHNDDRERGRRHKAVRHVARRRRIRIPPSSTSGRAQTCAPITGGAKTAHAVHLSIQEAF